MRHLRLFGNLRVSRGAAAPRALTATAWVAWTPGGARYPVLLHTLAVVPVLEGMFA